MTSETLELSRKSSFQGVSEDNNCIITEQIKQRLETPEHYYEVVTETTESTQQAIIIILSN